MKLFSTTHQEHATNEAWLRTWVIVAILMALLCGCASCPQYRNATAEQRAQDFFFADEEFYASDQYKRELEEDYETRVQLREQLIRNSQLAR